MHADEDDAWLDLFSGVPAWTPDGRLVRIADEAGARVVMVGDQRLTSDALHVRAVLDIGERDVLFSAAPGEGAGLPRVPGEIGVYGAWFRAGGDGPGGCEPIALSPDPAVTSAVRGGDVLVLPSLGLAEPGVRVAVVRADDERAPADWERLTEIASHAERPVLTAAPHLVFAGERNIPCAVLLPTGDGPLPVLMDPYGGPHGQQVLAAHNAYLTSQWFAEQGFAVLVADGRATPGRSSAGRRRSGTRWQR